MNLDPILFELLFTLGITRLVVFVTIPKESLTKAWGLNPLLRVPGYLRVCLRRKCFLERKAI